VISLPKLAKVLSWDTDSKSMKLEVREDFRLADEGEGEEN